MAKITPKTTDLFVGTILKAINIKENTPFQLNKFYPITDGDGVGALFVGGYSDVELTMHELGDYFEHIATLDDIEDLEKKALLLKQIFNEFKELSEDADEKISKESLINETIASLTQDEVYQCDKIELRFICNNMDITMVEQCSCCGKFISPNDLPYERFINANEEIEELDEVTIVKNDILNNIFCVDANNDIVIPTFNELVEADYKYQSNWPQLFFFHYYSKKGPSLKFH